MWLLSLRQAVPTCKSSTEGVFRCVAACTVWLFARAVPPVIVVTCPKKLRRDERFIIPPDEFICTFSESSGYFLLFPISIVKKNIFELL